MLKLWANVSRKWNMNSERFVQLFEYSGLYVFYFWYYCTGCKYAGYKMLVVRSEIKRKCNNVLWQKVNRGQKNQGNNVSSRFSNKSELTWSFSFSFQVKGSVWKIIKHLSQEVIQSEQHDTIDTFLISFSNQHGFTVTTFEKKYLF